MIRTHQNHWRNLIECGVYSHKHALEIRSSCYLLSVLTVKPYVCCSDREYPRLGQMIVDYENPLKKMMEEFVPHGKVEQLTSILHLILVKWNQTCFTNETLLSSCSLVLFCPCYNVNHTFALAFFHLFILSLHPSYFLSFPVALWSAVAIGCVDQSPDGLSQEKSFGWPVEECPAAFSYLCAIHHAQPRTVRHG